MQKVYLDNNIFVDIEYGNLNLSDFLSYRDTCYYFSSAHIEELIKGEGIEKLSIEKRLKLIEQLTKTNCILSGLIQPEFVSLTPQQLYDRIRRGLTNIMREIVNSSVMNFNIDREKFMEYLKINKKEINNIPPQDILPTINEVLFQYMNIDLVTYIQRTEAIGYTLYYTLFNLLDFLCYHKDKQTENSNVARLYDSFHAFSAQICDVLVSEDKKMRYKTKAVYSYLGIKTKVLSMSEFLSSKY